MVRYAVIVSYEDEVWGVVVPSGMSSAIQVSERLRKVDTEVLMTSVGAIDPVKIEIVDLVSERDMTKLIKDSE